MSDGNRKDNVWSLPKFRFEVDFGTEIQGIAFQEVSGMDNEVQVIEYRASNSKLFSTTKMPGIAKYGNVTMKRGIFVNNDAFWKWLSDIQMNTIERQDVLIKLLDEQDDVIMQWKLVNAWPTKITSTDLKSDGNEVAVDTLEIAHEQLEISTGK